MCTIYFWWHASLSLSFFLIGSISLNCIVLLEASWYRNLAKRFHYDFSYGSNVQYYLVMNLAQFQALVRNFTFS